MIVSGMSKNKHLPSAVHWAEVHEFRVTPVQSATALHTKCSMGIQVYGKTFPAVLVHRNHIYTTGEGGGGGRWHDAWLYCCLQLAAPIGLSPRTLALSLNPFHPQVVAPIGPSGAGGLKGAAAADAGSAFGVACFRDQNVCYLTGIWKFGVL